MRSGGLGERPSNCPFMVASARPNFRQTVLRLDVQEQRDSFRGAGDLGIYLFGKVPLLRKNFLRQRRPREDQKASLAILSIMREKSECERLATSREL